MYKHQAILTAKQMLGVVELDEDLRDRVMRAIDLLHKVVPYPQGTLGSRQAVAAIIVDWEFSKGE